MTQKEKKLLPVIRIGDPEAAQKASKLIALGFRVPQAVVHGQLEYNPNIPSVHPLYEVSRKVVTSYYFKSDGTIIKNYSY